MKRSAGTVAATRAGADLGNSRSQEPGPAGVTRAMRHIEGTAPEHTGARLASLRTNLEINSARQDALMRPEVSLSWRMPA